MSEIFTGLVWVRMYLWQSEPVVDAPAVFVTKHSLSKQETKKEISEKFMLLGIGSVNYWFREHSLCTVWYTKLKDTVVI